MQRVRAVLRISSCLSSSKTPPVRVYPKAYTKPFDKTYDWLCKISFTEFEVCCAVLYAGVRTLSGVRISPFYHPANVRRAAHLQLPLVVQRPPGAPHLPRILMGQGFSSKTNPPSRQGLVCRVQGAGFTGVPRS